MGRQGFEGSQDYLQEACVGQTSRPVLLVPTPMQHTGAPRARGLKLRRVVREIIYEGVGCALVEILAGAGVGLDLRKFVAFNSLACCPVVSLPFDVSSGFLVICLFSCVFLRFS